jgi:2-methylcitrate dehydratase PrpD
MAPELPTTSVAETLAGKIVALKPGALPAGTARKCEDLLIDVVGLCVTARNEDYITSALAGCDDDGPCTAIGHGRTLTAAGAAFVNGTAAHGEDFDDTFEGGPVHAGAVIVPAVLAACERHNPDGRMALIGIAVGAEVLCRLSVAEGRSQGRSSDRGVLAMGAAAGVGAVSSTRDKSSMRRRRRQHGRRHHRISRGGRLDQTAACRMGGAIRHSRGAAGAGRVFWSADGVRGRARAVPWLRAHHEGRLRRADRRFRRALGDGHAGVQAPIRGTMARPYIDCARRLAARGIKAEDIDDLCEVAEGDGAPAVEPLADKQRPRNGYAAKFAVPYCSRRLCPWRRRLAPYEPAIRDTQVLALAAKVKFVVDPDNPYPNNYTGHVKATMKDGSTVEERQPYLRGGAHEPLTRQDVTDKFLLNAEHGGWSRQQSDAALKLLATLYHGRIDLSSLRG